MFNTFYDLKNGKWVKQLIHSHVNGNCPVIILALRANNNDCHCPN